MTSPAPPPPLSIPVPPLPPAATMRTSAKVDVEKVIELIVGLV